MMDFAREKKLFLMEGMWTRFFPAVVKCRELLQDGAIGQVLTANADFGVNVPRTTERLWSLEMGGGALLDLGVYPIAFLTMIFGDKLPMKIGCHGALSDTGVDMYSNITLEYPGNRTGTAQVSCIASTPEEVHISGTKGRIKIHSNAHIAERLTIYRPGKLRSDPVREETFSFPIPTPPPETPKFCYPGSNGFQYEATSAQSCIKKGLLENPDYPLSESLTIAHILDELRQQLGVKYAADSN